MPGRTTAEAFNAYAEPLNSVFHCITEEPLRKEVLREHPNEDGIFLEEFYFIHSPVRLKAPDLSFAFTFEQYFRILWSPDHSAYKVKTESYTYEIEAWETHHELFSFHWEPHSKVSIPHLHLGFGMRGHELPIDNKAHIPSGRVPVEDVVAFLIKELKIEPICENWEEIIGRARERFIEHKSW